MFIVSQYFIKSKKYTVILLSALVIMVGLGSHFAWSSNGLPRIDSRTLAVLAKQHPVVVSAATGQTIPACRIKPALPSMARSKPVRWVPRLVKR